MQIVIEDTVTGARRTVDASQVTKLSKTERATTTAEGLSKHDEKVQQTTARQARLAIAATKLGLPLPGFLKLVRQVAGINCPFCQLGTKVLEHIDRLGEEKALDLLQQVLVAKENQDHIELAKLVEEFKRD